MKPVTHSMPDLERPTAARSTTALWQGRLWEFVASPEWLDWQAPAFTATPISSLSG